MAIETKHVVGHIDIVASLRAEILGKPVDVVDATRMLKMLRGRTHSVVTGVAAVDTQTGRSAVASRESRVTIRPLSDDELLGYIAQESPLDKAGAYAVQDLELRPAEWWKGCYSNIVGLPLCRLLEMLRALGHATPDPITLHAPAGCTVTCPFLPENQQPERQQ